MTIPPKASAAYLVMEASGLIVDRVLLDYPPDSTVQDKIDMQKVAVELLSKKHAAIMRDSPASFYVEAQSKLNSFTTREVDDLLMGKVFSLYPPARKVK